MTSAVAESSEQVWNNFNLFASTKETAEEHAIAFQGKVPEWLKGTLYRNGPGANEVNDDPSTGVYHAFDGFALIQKYTIEGPSQVVRFRTSFVKSHTYTESMKQGRLVVRQFGTDPCKSILGRFQSLFRARDPSSRTDDTGVTVQIVNNELLALTETIMGNAMDPNTLEPIGPLTALPYAKSVPSEIMTITTAHVMYDERRKMTIGYASRITSKEHLLDVVFIYDDPQEDIKQSMMPESLIITDLLSLSSNR
jgi:beta,beta-carotene 9',10'-dioxygenase